MARGIVIALVGMVAVAGMSMGAGAQQSSAIGSVINNTSDGGGPGTPAQRAFGEKFAQAVQAQDKAQLRALIPPATLKCFDDNRKQRILDDWIDEELKYEIPKEHKISVSPIPPDMVKPSKMSSYPVPRTHLMEFQFANADGGGATITQEIGEDGGNWYAIPPCPTAARMERLANDEKKRVEHRAQVERTYAGLKEPLRSRLRALIDKNDKPGARKLCIDTLHVDYPTARAVVARLAAEKSSQSAGGIKPRR